MAAIPVSSAVLRWARDFRGLSEEEAAARLRISVEDLLAYEGGRPLSRTMFEAFAAKYNLPQATLFRRTPPPVPPRPTDYRTIEGRNPNDSFEFRVAVSEVRTLASQIVRLAHEDEDYVRPRLPRYNLEDDPEEIGERERARVGVTLADQKRWRADDAFRRWRTVVEAQGVFVFLKKFPLEDCRGFSFFEEEDAPCIVVNKSERHIAPRTFTLIHEYCHLLLRRPGISGRSGPVEAFCNRFAAAFLMPKTVLKEVLPFWPDGPHKWVPGHVALYAKTLKVSRQALALRMEQLGIAQTGYAQQFAYKPGTDPVEEDEPGSETGPTYVQIRLSELGGAYVGAFLNALDRGAIGSVATAEALGLAPDHFARARQTTEKQRELVFGDPGPKEGRG